MAVRLTLTHTCGNYAFDSREHRVIKVGRHTRAHVQLGDREVSRLHATIELDGRDARVVDLGTLAGTHVGGERITGKHQLEDGDVIRVGSTELAVTLEPILELPIEVPGRRCPPTPPAAPPVPDFTLPDATVPCRRGVGRDWLAGDYVTTEKYDTHYLVTQMRTGRRRSRAAVTVSLVSASLLIAALPVAIYGQPNEPTEVVAPASPPAALPRAPQPVEVEAPRPEPAAHVVRSGETLGTIAADRLGDVRAWRSIWRANRDRLDDPSTLEVGMVLAIPAARKP